MKQIQAEKIRELFMAVLDKLNCDNEVAHSLVDAMIQTSLRGVDSHGIRLFPHYVNGLEAGRINGKPNYTIEHTGDSTARLDADHTYGHAAGVRAMKEAIKMADETGIGAVGVYNSSHFGAAAYYALMAAEKGMIGLSFTHADSLMQSHSGKRAYLGTNPICFAAPCEKEEPFCLDMATTMFNWNKIKQYRENNEQLPPDIAVDGEGNKTTDPHAARALLPIGQFKGFGLSMMVEILCGILTGMPVGREITSMFETPITEHRYLGQFYIAIKIENFISIDIFKKQLQLMVDQVREEPQFSENENIKVAGDPEKKSFKERSEKGIPVTDEYVDKYNELSEKFLNKKTF